MCYKADDNRPAVSRSVPDKTALKNANNHANSFKRFNDVDR